MATVKQSGGDYGSLSSAFDNSETSISVEGTWTSADTTAATCSTASTTVTVDSDSFHGYSEASSPTYYRLAPTSGSHCITQSADNLSLDGFLINQNSTTSSAECVRQNGAYTLTATRMIFRCSANNTIYQDGIYLYPGSTVNADRCLFHTIGRCGINWQPSANGSTTQTINVKSCAFLDVGHHTGSETLDCSGGTGVKHRSGGMTTNLKVFSSFFIDCQRTITDQWKAGAIAFTEYNDNDNNWYGTYNIDLDNIASTDDSITTIQNKSFASATKNFAATGITEDCTASEDDTLTSGDNIIVQEYTASPYDLRLLDNAYNVPLNSHSNSTGTNSGLTLTSTDVLGTSRPQETNYDQGPFELVSYTRRRLPMMSPGA